MPGVCEGQNIYESNSESAEDLKKLISEKRVMYDHNVDQRDYKWSGKTKLKVIPKELLPSYIGENLIKFKEWLD